MSRIRVVAGVLVAALVLGGAAVWYTRDPGRQPVRATEDPEVAESRALLTGPRLVFRHTAVGPDYGLVAMVPLARPGGPRTLTGLSCDRIDVVATAGSCLQTRRGGSTSYRWLELGPGLEIVRDSELSGLPSRTRLSRDGSLVASTAFVTGHAYGEGTVSTATHIRAVGGADFGNLEEFGLEIDGERVQPEDRNVWGVTFADTSTFYATVSTGDVDYLVRGDLTARRLTALRAGVECPSLSPDRRRIAYKKDRGDDGDRWGIAVLDLATGKETVLRGESANVDDQVQWLDDDTLLYGLPRADEPGVTDVWSLDVAARARPRLLVEKAWSPAVVR